MPKRPPYTQTKTYLPPALLRMVDDFAAVVGLDRADVIRQAVVEYMTKPRGFLADGPPHGTVYGPSYRPPEGPGPPDGPPWGPQTELDMSGPNTSTVPPTGPSDGTARAGVGSGSGRERERSGSLSSEGADGGPSGTVGVMAADLAVTLVELLNREAGTALDPADPASIAVIAQRLKGTVPDGGRAATVDDITGTVQGLIGVWSRPAYYTLTGILGKSYWDRHAQARAPKTTTPAPGSSPGAERAARRQRAKR